MAAAGTERGLQFVGAESDLGGEADGHERRNGDQPAAAGNGIDQSGKKGGCKKKQQGERVGHIPLTLSLSQRERVYC